MEVDQVKKFAGDGGGDDSVSSAHLELLKQGKLCDVVFVIGSQQEEVKAHKAFLAARSPVFEIMFSEPWIAARKDKMMEVEIPDTDLETFESFLHFIYADKFEGSVPEIINLFPLAHKYSVEVLVTKCEKFLVENFGLENAIEVYQLARLYSRADLFRKVEDYMARYFVSLAETKDFNRIDEETLLTLLARDDLNISECKLFSVVTGWGKAQLNKQADGDKLDKALESVLEKLLPLIRFTTMTLAEFASVVRPTNLLPQDVMLDIFTYYGCDEKEKKALESRLPYCKMLRRRSSETLNFYTNLEQLEDLGQWCSHYSYQQVLENISFLFSSTCVDAKEQTLTGIVLQWPKLYDQNNTPFCEGLETFFTVTVKVGQPGYSESSSYNGYNNCYYRPIFTKDSINVVVGGSGVELRIYPPIHLAQNQRYSIELQATLPGSAVGEVYYKRAAESGPTSRSCDINGTTLYVQSCLRNGCPGTNSGELHLIRGVVLTMLT